MTNDLVRLQVFVFTRLGAENQHPLFLETVYLFHAFPYRERSGVRITYAEIKKEERHFLFKGGEEQGAFLLYNRFFNQSYQYMCCPPLIDKVEPVINPASSSVRKQTPLAISEAWPNLPTGIPATIFSKTLSGTAATMSVSM